MVSSESLQTVENAVQQVKVGAVGRMGGGFLYVQEVFGDEVTHEYSCHLQMDLAMSGDLRNGLSGDTEFEDLSPLHARALDRRLAFGAEADLRFEGELDL